MERKGKRKVLGRARRRNVELAIIRKETVKGYKLKKKRKKKGRREGIKSGP
jgi:hypothetical protein